MMRKIPMAWALALTLLGACSDEDSLRAPDAAIAGEGGVPATSDASVPADASALDCYPTPSNYLELINACTTAERVEKRPVLPLLLADGGLPPLP